MQHLQSTYFLDYEVVVRETKTKLDEARGHLLMLGDESDTALSIASLIDGSAIDFLFGVKFLIPDPAARKRANDVKRFMATLDEEGQEAVAQFYYVVFASILSYHRQMDHMCACLWSSWLRQDLRSEVEEAFHHLRFLVTERNLLEDDRN
jgi:hypothetical protein